MTPYVNYTFCVGNEIMGIIANTFFYQKKSFSQIVRIAIIKSFGREGLENEEYQEQSIR